MIGGVIVYSCYQCYIQQPDCGQAGSGECENILGGYKCVCSTEDYFFNLNNLPGEMCVNNCTGMDCGKGECVVTGMRQYECDCNTEGNTTFLNIDRNPHMRCVDHCVQRECGQGSEQCTPVEKFVDNEEGYSCECSKDHYNRDGIPYMECMNNCTDIACELGECLYGDEKEKRLKLVESKPAEID